MAHDERRTDENCGEQQAGCGEKNVEDREHHRDRRSLDDEFSPEVSVQDREDG
ncbi:hypothetical protein ACX80N_04665 [Arthrobacter sp. MDT2-16]